MSFKFIKFIKTRYADPICAMDINDNYLVFGTMLGSAVYYYIKGDKTILLCENNYANITGIKIYNDHFHISVGELKVLFYNNVGKNEDYSIVPKFSEKHNRQYNNMDEVEINRLPNGYTILKDNFLLRLHIYYSWKTDEPLSYIPTTYSLLNIDNNEIKMGKLDMSNYVVPFDFNNNFLIFIDYLAEKNRVFNIYNFNEKNLSFSLKIDELQNEKIGHISFIKILKENLLFVVQNYNSCELRDFNFNYQTGFTHIGTEVIAFDIFKDNNDIIYIITLDVDSNVNLYDTQSKKERNLFNVDNLKDIPKIIKDQGFFTMNYPYYIKMSESYISISSDYGCVLIEYKL